VILHTKIQAYIHKRIHTSTHIYIFGVTAVNQILSWFYCAKYT